MKDDGRQTKKPKNKKMPPLFKVCIAALFVMTIVICLFMRFDEALEAALTPSIHITVKYILTGAYLLLFISSAVYIILSDDKGKTKK